MITRCGAPVGGAEKEVLAGFLEHYRSVILEICEGLSEEDLRRPMTPSGTSLLGMVKRLMRRSRTSERGGCYPAPVP